MRKMRHKNWKTYLKIACSWLLIFSICFMNLETVSASEDETSVVTEQEETQDTEAFTSETDAQQTETEQTSEQFTSETETETSAETEEQIPDSIEVEKLEKEIQEATSNGQVPTTKLVEYVDESGNAIEGAPETIELGKISDHSELNISDKDYEFKSAKVNDADCSFIGVYKDTVYWSSDNINANKFADGQKLTMTYALKEKEKESEISKTEDLEQEKDTTETKESEKEISEKSSEQIIDNEKSTEQASDEQLPDTISVQSLNIAMQRSVTNGNEQTTNRVEYVDAKGTLINGAPTTIAYGNISEHKALLIDGKHFDFLSAKVNGKDCVYIGEYNGVLYYSTDGVIAIKMEDRQKVTMTYQEYYLVTIQEALPTNCDPGTICTKKGSEDVPVETNKQIRVNAGEDWVVSVTPGAPNNKKRYKITSVTSQNGANITKNAGDDYGATYAIRFQKDDTITVTYDAEGVYRITINTVDNNGFEYINIAHSEKNNWEYLPEQHKLVWTYTEDQVKSDGSIDLPKFHIKRGYRLVHMVLNGETVAAADSNKEVPDGVGSNHGVKGHAGELIVNAEITNEYTKNKGDETECSFEYSFNVQCTDGGCRDLDFDLAPYQTGQQVLTVRLKTDNRRSGEGIDVVMWDPDQNKLVPMKDNDTVNMDPVGEATVVTLKKRQVRIFFAKPKPGYQFAGVGVDSAQTSGGVNTDGGKSRSAEGDLNNMNATSLGKKGEFQVYDEIWEAAKNAASSAGYEKFLAFAGEKTTHNTDWELYAGYFMSAKKSIYVHYNSGAGEGVLPADAVVKNIPYNEELDDLKGRPMQSYGENPNTHEGIRGMGSTFLIGEGWPEPTCDGYEFLGWKLRLTPFPSFGTPQYQYSDKLYQHNEVFRISEENYEFAANHDLPVSIWNNEAGYQIVAQWKKADTKTVRVEHYLKQPDGNEYLGKTTVGSILFSEEQDTFTIFGNPEPDGTFPGYVFDKDDSRKQTKVTIKKDEISDNYVLKVYYKPTVLTVRKIVAGYNLEPDKAFSFTIQANAPEGTDADAAILGSDLVYIKKENGTAEKLTFTNNQAAFTLKKDESVDISCLPTGWTYTVTETAPGTNFEVSYSINGGSKTVGEAASFTMAATGTEEIQFTNTSTVAPPVTGRNIQNNSWIMMLIVVLLIGIGSMVFFRKVKRKYR